MLGAQLIHGCLNSAYMVLVTVHLYMLCLVTQSYPALCDPMDCGPPGSSIQARILEGVAMSSTRGSSQPRD